MSSVPPSTPDPRRRLLERILLGELAPDSAEARALLQEHPEWEAEMNAMHSVTRTLDILTSDAEEVVREAQAEVTAADRGLVRETLGRAPLASSRPRTRPWWRRPSVAAAAAALLVAGWLWFPRGAQDPLDSGMLSGQGQNAELMQPRGQRVGSYGDFSVDVTLSGAQILVLRVRDAASGETLGSHRLDPGEGSTWRPSPEQRARIDSSRRILWTYTIELPGAQTGDKGLAEAWLAQ